MQNNTFSVEGLFDFLNAGVSAREIRSRIATFWKVIQVFLAVPKAPMKMETYTCTGLMPVKIVVRIPQTTSASRMASRRILKPRCQGRASRFTM